MNRNLLTSLFAVLSLVTLGCGAVDMGATSCARDTDCKGDRLCTAGLCVSPSGTGGSGGSSGTGGGNAGTGGGSGGSSFSCCLNNAFYGCATKAAFDACAGFDVGACLSACSPTDIMCPNTCIQRGANSTHDASQCTRDASKDGTCSSSTCNDAHGAACVVSGDCSSGNCTGGYCRTNSAGAACVVSGDCTSGNCTQGCCRNRTVGSACVVSGDCDSRNCTSGVCSGNSFGSACVVSGDCTSGNCTSGHCR